MQNHWFLFFQWGDFFKVYKLYSYFDCNDKYLFITLETSTYNGVYWYFTSIYVYKDILYVKKLLKS